MKEKMLPVGSVVMLKEATRAVVIIGYFVVEEGSDKIWDYLGCAYPIGVITPNKNLLFNTDQIDKVLFMGYLDEEGNQFLDSIKESVNSVTHE